MSGWLPIPLPKTQVEDLLRAQLAPGTPVSLASCSFRWGPGELQVQSLALGVNGQALALETAVLQLDLVPWSATFLQPRRLQLRDGLIRTDRLNHLLGQTGEGGGGYPSLECSQVRFLFAAAEEEEWEALVVQARGEGSREGLRLVGTITTAYGPAGRVQLEITRDGSRLDLLCPEAPLQIPAFLPFDLQADAFSLQARLEEGHLRIAAELAGVTLSLDQPPLSVRLDQLAVFGDPAVGLRVKAQGAVLESPVEARAWLRWKDGAWDARVDARAHAFVVDEERISWIRTLDAGVANALEALEMRGGIPIRAALEWEQSQETLRVVHLPLDGVAMTFRGFLEKDGDRPSFPYPIANIQGSLVLAEQALSFAGQGIMGDAPAQFDGGLQLGEGPAGIQVDFSVAGLPLDSRITSALGGTPEAASVWRELGGPKDGTADFQFSLRRALRNPTTDLRLRAQLAGASLRPRILPIAVVADAVQVEWRPGAAMFSGDIHALGGPGVLQGEIRSVVDGKNPALTAQLSFAQGLEPSSEDLLVLEGFLRLPEGMSSFHPTGPSPVSLSVRRPSRNSSPQVLLRWLGDHGTLAWQRARASLAQLSGAVTAVVAEGRTLIAAPRVSGICAEGAVQMSLVGVGFGGAQAATATLHAENIGLEEQTIRLTRAVVGLEADPSRSLEWGGQASLTAALQLGASPEPRGLLRLHPLKIREPTLVQAGAAQVEGSFLLQPGGLEKGEGVVRGRVGTFLFSNASLKTADGQGQVRALLNSPEGLALDGPLPELLSPGAWAAMRKLGLEGRIGAQDLQLLVDADREQMEFSLTGHLLLHEVSIAAAPGFAEGEGKLEIHSFRWQDAENFQGKLFLQNGQGLVSGFRMQEARARIALTPDQLRWTELDAKILGGRVRTGGLGLDDESFAGQLRIGLTSSAPLFLHVILDGLDLGRVREELGLGGDLDGKIHGELNFVSRSPDPADYQGDARILIENGALGAVPILSRMWRAAGVQPPVFDSGKFTLRANPKAHRGRLRMEGFQLVHPLLSVLGEGWVGLDGYLDLKVTVRSGFVPLLGWGIPLLTDVLFDPLVEQDVFGPAENPRVVQRALHKLSGKGDERIPFPLWVPKPEETDWRRSPALPFYEEEASPAESALKTPPGT